MYYITNHLDIQAKRCYNIVKRLGDSYVYDISNRKFSEVYEFRCGFHASWFMECHLHEFSELLYCKKGTVDIVINSKKLTLSEKHLLYIPPNYIHQFLQTDAELICAVFSNDFIPLYFI